MRRSSQADLKPQPKRPRGQHGLPSGAIVMGCLLYVGVVGFLDLALGNDFSLRLLYVPAVALAAWMLGVGWALIFSLMVTIGVSALSAGVAGGWSSKVLWAWEATVRFVLFCVLSVAIGRLRRLFDREREMARNDFLTGLPNRRSFLERADAELNRSRRTERPLSVAYIDCDHFKAINDSLGHAAGDRLLGTVATCLRRSTRSYDIAARLGGDEFALLLPETTAESAAIVMERLQENLNSEMQTNGWPVTFSIGVATFREMPATAEELLPAADELMYTVKRTGKGCVTSRVIGGEKVPR